MNMFFIVVLLAVSIVNSAYVTNTASGRFRDSLKVDSLKSSPLLGTESDGKVKKILSDTLTVDSARAAFVADSAIKPPAYCKTVYDPSGYAMITHDDSLKFNQSTRTVKIAGSHEILYKGISYTKTNDSIQIPATNGLWGVYYDDNMTLQCSQTMQPFYLPFVATVYWNATQSIGLCGDERHGAVMDWKTHEYKHDHIGALYNTGLALTAGNTSFSLEAGAIDDEDIRHQHNAVTKCNLLYYNGSSTFTWDTGNTTLYKGTAGSLYYNNGTTLTAASSNYYIAIHLFATNDINGVPVAILGQRQDVNPADAKANNTYASLTLTSLPINEYVYIYTVYYRNDATPYEDISDHRTKKINNIVVSSSGGTSDHALQSNLGYAVSGHTGFATGTNGKADSSLTANTAKNSDSLNHLPWTYFDTVGNGAMHDSIAKYAQHGNLTFGDSATRSHIQKTTRDSLISGGNTVLHIHDSRYYTETELTNNTIDLMLDSVSIRVLKTTGTPIASMSDSVLILKNGVVSRISASTFRTGIGAATPQQIQDTTFKYISGTNGQAAVFNGTHSVTSAARVDSARAAATSAISDTSKKAPVTGTNNHYVLKNGSVLATGSIRDTVDSIRFMKIPVIDRGYIDTLRGRGVSGSTTGPALRTMNYTVDVDTRLAEIRNSNGIQFWLSQAKMFFSGVFTPDSISSRSITQTDLTGSRVVVTDATKKLVSSSVTPTVLGYLDVASSVQGLLNAKADKLHGITIGRVPYANASNTMATSNIRDTVDTIVVDGNIRISKVTSATVLTVENTGDNSPEMNLSGNRSATRSTLGDLNFKWGNNIVARIRGLSGSDATNKDDGAIAVYVSNNSSTLDTAIIISQDKSVRFKRNIAVDSTANVDTLIVDWSTSDTGRAAKIGYGKKLKPLPIYQISSSEGIAVDAPMSHISGTNANIISLDTSQLDSLIGGGFYSQATDGVQMRTYGGWQAVKNDNVSGHYDGRYDAFVRKDGGGVITFLRAISDAVLYLGRAVMNTIVIEQKTDGDIYIGNSDYYASEEHIIIRNNMTLFPGYADGRLAYTGDEVKLSSGDKNLFLGNDWSNSGGSIRVNHNSGDHNTVQIHPDDTLEATNISKTFGRSTTGVCTLKTQVGVPVATASFTVKIIGDMVTVMLQEIGTTNSSGYALVLWFPDNVFPQCKYSNLYIPVVIASAGSRMTGTLVRITDTSRGFYIYDNDGYLIATGNDGVYTQSFQYFSN